MCNVHRRNESQPEIGRWYRYSMQSTVLLIYHQAVPVPSPSQVLLYSLFHFLFHFPKKKTKMEKKKKRQRVFPFINSHSNIF